MYDNKLRQTLQVSRDNVNESGQLSHCHILQEVASINDTALLQAFGQLSYQAIRVTRYHVYFQEAAKAGDVLQIEAHSTLAGATRLLVDLSIQVVRGRKRLQVLTGNFTFVHND